MNITEANARIENITTAIAELDARIASEKKDHANALNRRDNLSSLLASGDIKPDQIASVQSEPEGHATIIDQYRRQRDELTRALETAKLNLVVVETESDDSPLLTHEDKLAVLAEIVDAMTPALTAYVEKVNAHNAEWERINAQAVRTEYGTAPVRKRPNDSMPRVTVGDRDFVFHMNSADNMFSDAITAKLRELRA